MMCSVTHGWRGNQPANCSGHQLLDWLQWPEVLEPRPVARGIEASSSKGGPGKVPCVVHYRSFRNNDSPGLVAIWNEAFTARGAVRLRHSSPLENYVFGKPYFDPAGLILAVDNDVPVGFAHAGFGPNRQLAGLDQTTGLICLIGVRPSHRRQGIGRELLRRSEAYLRSRGGQALLAGPMAPYTPFYFGLYGGSDMPGFLASDLEAESFLQHHGYQVQQACLLFQRMLSQPVNVVDGRFPALREGTRHLRSCHTPSAPGCLPAVEW